MVAGDIDQLKETVENCIKELPSFINKLDGMGFSQCGRTN